MGGGGIMNSNRKIRRDFTIKILILTKEFFKHTIFEVVFIFLDIVCSIQYCMQ